MDWGRFFWAESVAIVLPSFFGHTSRSVNTAWWQFRGDRGNGIRGLNHVPLCSPTLQDRPPTVVPPGPGCNQATRQACRLRL
jgi:hypothetical protein